MSGFDEATQQQIEAANPRASTWLSANAGSGKTRVLTDRVALLLLGDVPPQNILCLTYTKAAASEMQNRLFKRLGEWAMLEDVDLRTALGKLGVPVALDAETLSKARRLFAGAIETPGGLKIQTIHSFCAGILRRFPLEASVSPGFSEMDDQAAARLQVQVLDHVAAQEPELFAEMAALVSDADMTGLAAQLSSSREQFKEPPDWSRTLRTVGLPEGFSPESTLAEIAAALEDPAMEQVADLLSAQSKTMQEFAIELRNLRATGLDAEAFTLLVKRFLYASGDNMNQPKPSVLTKNARRDLGPLEEDVDALAETVAAAKQAFMAHDVALKSHILHRFAAAFLPEYARQKDLGGWLDFDDQIQKAEALLAREGVAEWVLYKLDGGIDHILVDEAQDTSPLQWRVIEHLTREFTAGTGVSEAGERSIFVVGDLKQSIYSFQGADPTGFINMRQAFAEKLTHIDLTLQQLELKYSFRSSGEILSTVDVTFGADNTHGMGGAVSHLAFKTGLPGRVDLWPVIEPKPKPEKREWYDPVDMVSDEHHVVELAQHVARQAREMVNSGFLWEEHDGGFHPRAIHAGDILILVQGRGGGSNVSLFQEIIAACKGQGLDVAGADVLKLGEELAVRDILSVLAFLSMPEDDLALAEALRSPLFGWSEAALYELATERAEKEYLWAALRRRQKEFPEAYAILRDLRDVADYLRPYDLIERLLTRHDGRRRLMARLGEEASDGVDALLTQALAFEQAEATSLTGFLARMEGAEVDVKRRAEGRGRKLRVMTVHGSKGLESPIVILPDCGNRRQSREFRGDLLPTDGAPLWNVAKAQSPEPVNALRQAAIDKRAEESQRLLYVAMTRAEQWLIVAAAGDLGKAGDSWYEQVRAGLEEAGAGAQDFPAGQGLRLQAAAWDSACRPDGMDGESQQTAVLPVWANNMAAPPIRVEGTLSPSDLGGAKIVFGDSEGLSEEEAKLHGTRIHLLLEQLPNFAAGSWPDAVKSILGPDVLEAETTGLLEEAGHILENEALEFLFSEDTLAEVDISASLSELAGRRVHGAIDRLVIRPDSVLAVDFKTNAKEPVTASETPEGLLRQMGAYAAALKQVFPGRRVECAILWTRSGRLMPLPDEMLHAAVSRAALP
ncbi:double-strand break repair helicase AddA [Aliiruegeria sabulilitoris]|uniref:double-strand break repair helicase AddA n=1 Tax=Aliiruegeria sabulilitoris TaxID=1510458 RepID=UPI000835BE54|nr:double-strand break repair helicase AddA [Aliiruegeria sabulilitoris]NDR57550.1 double-strand break repair helicase AddA [Pseudoruegeria sp. M32A2M]